MDIRQLTYFAAVVNEGTMTAAAKSLHISQPPLSTQIRLLEQELGCTLFNRDTRHIQLTDAGRILYQRACVILDMVSSVRNEMADIQAGSAGTLRLGVVSSICGYVFPEWLRRFCGSRKKLKFELYEGNTYQLLEQVRSNQVELAFVRTPFSAPDLGCVRLRDEPLCAVGRPGFFPDADNAVQLSGLTRAPLIFYRRWEQILTDAFRKAGLRPSLFCVSDDARTTVGMAESGFGIGIVPRSAVPEKLAAPNVCRVIDCPEFHSRICAVYRKGMYVSSAARQFLDQVRAECRRQPGVLPVSSAERAAPVQKTAGKRFENG